MAIRIKDVGALAEKYSRNATNAAGDYKDGVAGAGGEWETQTAAAEPNYDQGVQAAIARHAYGKGVRAAGAAKYVDRAVKMGALRYAGGVQNAKGDWQKGFAPVAQVLASIQLPPRGPTRSPQNTQRSHAVTAALSAWKESQ